MEEKKTEEEKRKRNLREREREITLLFGLEHVYVQVWPD